MARVDAPALIAEARNVPETDASPITMLVHSLADALEEMTANRDEFRNAWNAQGFEILRLEAERDRYRAAIEAAMRVPSVAAIDSWTQRNVAEEQRRILAAVLDESKGQGNERDRSIRHTHG